MERPPYAKSSISISRKASSKPCAPRVTPAGGQPDVRPNTLRPMEVESRLPGVLRSGGVRRPPRDSMGRASASWPHVAAGVTVAWQGYGTDERVGHIYALSLPITRSRALVVRTGSAALLLVLPAL